MAYSFFNQIKENAIDACKRCNNSAKRKMQTTNYTNYGEMSAFISVLHSLGYNAWARTMWDEADCIRVNALVINGEEVFIAGEERR